MHSNFQHQAGRRLPSSLLPACVLISRVRKSAADIPPTNACHAPPRLLLPRARLRDARSEQAHYFLVLCRPGAPNPPFRLEIGRAWPPASNRRPFWDFSKPYHDDRPPYRHRPAWLVATGYSVRITRLGAEKGHARGSELSGLCHASEYDQSLFCPFSWRGWHGISHLDPSRSTPPLGGP